MTAGSPSVTFAFGVTPEQVATVANQCQTTADEVAHLSWLRTYASDLESQWLGIASGSFSLLMADWDIYASMLYQALTDIGQGLHTNHLNYTSSELTNTNNIQKINGSLPSAPGATTYTRPSLRASAPA